MRMISSAFVFTTGSTLAFITEPLPRAGIPDDTSSYKDARYWLYIFPLSLARARTRSVVPEPY